MILEVGRWRTDVKVAQDAAKGQLLNSVITDLYLDIDVYI